MEMKISPDLIRKLRKDASWSQEDLAAASGLSVRTIQRIESEGVAAIGSKRALAAAFDLSPNDLSMADPEIESRPRFWLGMLTLWVGIAWLMGLGWGVGLLGIGVIHVACQLWRRTVERLPVEWHGVVIGALFVLSGVASLNGVDAPVAPVLLVCAGILLMLAGREKKGRAEPAVSPVLNDESMRE